MPRQQRWLGDCPLARSDVIAAPLGCRVQTVLVAQGTGRPQDLERRTALLDALIHLRAPVADLAAELRGFPWDRASWDLVELSPAIAIDVLTRFVSGEVSVQQIVSWADEIEMRDDIDYDAPFPDLLFEFSAPEINGAVTPEKAREWIERLSSVR